MSVAEKHTFQAEIQQLLDIVIHSLYTDREVFVRELISNASDACEKLRFLQATGAGEMFQADTPPSILISADEKAGTLTLADTGVGMSQGELVENLGTIAHSGTKAFLKQIAEKGKADAKLIGQFGVGFYSSFMAATKVTVYTRSWRPDEQGWRWTSEGGGGYEIEPAPDLPRGTRIVLELKDDAKEFAQVHRLESLIRRYSNFVSFPIELDGKRVNTVQAIWARNKSEVKEEEYSEFYKYVGHDSEPPLYRLHFTADAPLSIQSVLFVPSRNWETLGMMRQECQVNLHCRKVLIETAAKGLFPDWLRFLKGVVDSEDLPLNVSRERMQDSELLRKLNRALTSRFLRHLAEESEKDPATYDKFYGQYGRFLKEGVLTDFEHRDAVAKLLRYESSSTEPGKTTSLADYVSRMPSDQAEIYYLHAADRAGGETSPTYEVFRARKLEVLYLLEPVDEFVMDRLGEFAGKKLVAAEKARLSVPEPDTARESLSKEDAESLRAWMKESLGTQVNEVRVSERLVDSPAIALSKDEHMTASMKRALRLAGADSGADAGAAADFEFNPRHGLLRRLAGLRQTDPELAGKVAGLLFDNARMSAGLLEDPRPMLSRMNEVMEKMLASR